MKKAPYNVIPIFVMLFIVSIFLLSCETSDSSGQVAYVQKTGQTTSYATGDDGDLQKGVAWPSPRFTDNADGTVTDNLTELIWLKNANHPNSAETWVNAVTYCNNLADDGGELTDGSVAGDWRLPNVHELISLMDFSQYDPPLPIGHPFTNVQSNYYWSSTTYAQGPSSAFAVYMFNSLINPIGKYDTFNVWPVRGGK
jgi:hypothetical protein